jgi:hypothetical protein
MYAQQQASGCLYSAWTMPCLYQNQRCACGAVAGCTGPCCAERLLLLLLLLLLMLLLL